MAALRVLVKWKPVGAVPAIERWFVMCLERSLTRKLWIIVAVAIIVIVGCGVWVGNAIHVARAETRKYREQHSEAKILRKTADEIIATCGKPYATERGPDGKPVFLMYKQVEHGQYCGISLKDGVAVQVSFSGQ